MNSAEASHASPPPELLDLQIEPRPIASLTLRRNNPRTHSEKQIRQIAASIETFGFTNPVLIDSILPVIAGAAIMMDTHPLLLMVPVTISASFAFMMPVATPPNAIVFGSGWVTVPQMSRAGFILNFLGAALVTGAILLLVPLLI